MPGTTQRLHHRKNSKSKMANRDLLSVLMLGLSFMLVFTAFQTQGNMQQAVINSIHKEDPSFHGSGYISLAVVYAVFATANWIAPSILLFLGPKVTMFLGAITYVLFVASFLWPQTWLLYVASVLVGLGAAIIWTAQGNYLTLVSSKTTMSRNSGIFWAMLQCSMVFGNVFVYTKFRGQDTIDASMRLVVYIVLTVVCALGTLMLLFLPRPAQQQEVQQEQAPGGSGAPGGSEAPTAYGEFLKSVHLFATKDMLLLSVTFLYTGFQLSFFSGVYSTCLSFTLRFPDPKMLVGLSGICIGCGEILGGAVFGIFGKYTIRFGRDPIVLLGYLIHVLCFYLVFLNVPNDAPLRETSGTNYMSDGMPLEWLALFCSFLLGLGDSCYNTQIYSILGSVYSSNSGPAFALFKFTQSLSAACAFFYSSAAPLHVQLGILVVFATLGTATFCIVEWKAEKLPVASATDMEKVD